MAKWPIKFVDASVCEKSMVQLKYRDLKQRHSKKGNPTVIGLSLREASY